MPLEPEVLPISSIAYRLCARAARGLLQHHFRAVRTQCAEHLESARPPLIVYANHSSWWDAHVMMLLGRELMPGRAHYAPADPDLLERRPFLRKAGLFPATSGSPQGLAEFLRRSAAALAEGGVLWLMPQARAVDVRDYPLALRPILGALAARLPEVPLVPLAMEYTFWDSRWPEALVRFGAPQHIRASTPEEATRALEDALAITMLELQRASCTRDETAFQTLFSRSAGIEALLMPPGRARRPRSQAPLRD